ncbi:virulence factor family protein [Niabella ginsenosidivorans]|uniref:Virulence factor family protein n=1 Tax=Niabella ginsenosidivorans TaxID=1176587 RepID=A0A1A9I1H7_9BACT|nr:AcvB/VirJ family lysyl-phosphatidylglycerol hydrolase [Niabella ginsenosidivorans]ANH81476.1 virulence factor family protein [Niabella ginsenosidivorans]
MKAVNLFLIVVFTLWGRITEAQELPVKNWNGNNKKPLVVYISGDGGFNSFTNSFCTAINKDGYTIAAINARSYFWSKKTPEQAAADLTAYLDAAVKGRPNRQIILIGYSFGADVAPFIVNRLPVAVKKYLVGTVLMAPSASTDFEIHIADMWGKAKKRGMDVVAEINKLGNSRTAIIMAADDKDFPVRLVTLKNFKNEVLRGGHHFDGDTDFLAKTVQKYF